MTRHHLEVAAVRERDVLGVELGQHARATAEEDEVGDVVGAGEVIALATIREAQLRGQAERGRHVIVEEDRLAQLATLGVAHEAHRHDEDAEAAGREQIEAPAQEVGHRRLLAVAAVAVLERRLAALAERRIADDEVDAADLLVPVLRDPPLERAREHGEAGPHGGQERSGQRRVLDGGPADRRAAESVEREDEAADAGGRLDRTDHAVEPDEIGEQGLRDPGDLGDERARGVVLVDQGACVDLQRRRECGLRLVDREAAPPAVTREHAAIFDGV